MTTLVEEWLRETFGPPTQRDTTDLWPCGCLVSDLKSLDDGRYLLASHSLCDKHREEFMKEQEDTDESH